MTNIRHQINQPICFLHSQKHILWSGQKSPHLINYWLRKSCSCNKLKNVTSATPRYVRNIFSPFCAIFTCELRFYDPSQMIMLISKAGDENLTNKRVSVIYFVWKTSFFVADVTLFCFLNVRLLFGYALLAGHFYFLIVWRWHTGWLFEVHSCIL